MSFTTFDHKMTRHARSALRKKREEGQGKKHVFVDCSPGKARNKSSTGRIHMKQYTRTDASILYENVEAMNISQGKLERPLTKWEEEHWKENYKSTHPLNFCT